jgi:hypothetical protein
MAKNRKDNRDKMANEEVLQKINEDRSLIETIRKRQKQWIGHTRCKSLLN